VAVNGAGRLCVATVDADACPSLAKALGAASLPTVLTFKQVTVNGSHAHEAHAAATPNAQRPVCDDKYSVAEHKLPAPPTPTQDGAVFID